MDEATPADAAAIHAAADRHADLREFGDEEAFFVFTSESHAEAFLEELPERARDWVSEPVTFGGLFAALHDVDSREAAEKSLNTGIRPGCTEEERQAFYRELRGRTVSGFTCHLEHSLGTDKIECHWINPDLDCDMWVTVFDEHCEDSIYAQVTGSDGVTNDATLATGLKGLTVERYLETLPMTLLWANVSG